MRAQRRVEILLIIWWNLFCLVLLMWSAKGLFAQPTSSTISPKAFGSRSWRENGIAPQSLPLTNNLLWDVRLASDGQLYYWNGTEWVSITSSGGEISHNHQADVVDIFDDGGYFVGATVELALQETGSSIAGVSLDISTLQTSVDSIVADPRWTDARTPLAHIHSTSDVTSGTFADARISSSSITQHETPLESVLDLQDLQGAVIDSQVPDTITKSGTPSRCARFDSSGVLIAASGDCEAGDTNTGGSLTPPGGFDTQVQYNNGGVFGGDTGMIYNASTDLLTIAGSVQAGNVKMESNSVSAVTGNLNIVGVGHVNVSSTGGYGYYFRVDMTGVETSQIGMTSGNKIMFGINTMTLYSAPDIVALQLSSTGVHKFSDALALTPRSSPSVTCGAANTEGVIYTDTSHALCYCNGTAWTNLTPGDGGSCS